MLEKIVITDLLTALGVGGGSAGILVVVTLLWLHFRVKGNHKKVCDVETVCTQLKTDFINHDKKIDLIAQNVGNIVKIQETVSDKLETLVELHLEK